MANPLVFVVLLTLSISSKDDETEVWRRVELLPPAKSETYLRCTEGLQEDLALVRRLWGIMADRLDPQNKLQGVSGVCVGVDPDDLAGLTATLKKSGDGQ